MLSVLSIIYLAVLAGCAAAVLLTAIMFLIKKKAGKPLALYALCVMALLGLGFLVSMSNPVPNPRHTEPEPVVVSPGSQTPPTPWAIEQKPAPVEIVPVETEPADLSDESVAEPVPVADTVEDVPAKNSAKASAAPSKTNRPTPALAPVSATLQTQEPASAAAEPVSMTAQTQEPVRDSAPAALSTYEPMLGGEPEYAPMSNPELADNPEPTAMSNPELWDDEARLSADS